MAELGSRAQVVIVGGGIVGCSIAYHLTRRGISDVLLIEQGQLTSGTTWHAAGLVSQLKSSHSLTRLATYSARLFEDLEADTGQATGYRAPGSISVAADHQRWEELLRGMSMARTVGVDIRQIDLDEALELCPLLNIDDLVGALFIPQDGVTSPVDTTMALAKGARARGARIVQGTAVTGVVVEDGRAVGVDTEAGRVEAETVVLAAGIWTRQLAASAGVNVPVQACEHFYIVTEPIEGVQPNMPTVARPVQLHLLQRGDRQGHGRLLRASGQGLESQRHSPRPPVQNPAGRLGPRRHDIRAGHPPHARAGGGGLAAVLQRSRGLHPRRGVLPGRVARGGPLLCGRRVHSVGIQSAGGVGWVLADWIVDGHPPMDLSAVDIRRSFGFQCEPAYLDARIPESLGLLYAMHWPFRQYETARGIRTSPLHERMDAAGAVFGEAGGWERPNWFAEPGQTREYHYSWGPQNWFKASGVECEAVRAAVGLFDQTSFAKFTVEGPDAMALLNWVCANEVDVPIGRAVYTQWLNDCGGIEADLTVTRRGENSYWVVTSAATATRDWAWLRRAARGRDVALSDVTDNYAVLGLMGPNSRAVLSQLCDADLGNDGFPFGTAQNLCVAGAEVLALRMTYVGELGWELYTPHNQAEALYDALVDIGAHLGLRPAGYHAMNSLRTEAGYCHWGHDITDEDTP